jgi:type VI secretion system protein ImpJ
MKNFAVYWSQGLFLRPHHLQAADRYWSEVLHESIASQIPHCYGLQRLEIDPSALDAQQFGVRALRGVLKDGTLLDLSAGALGRCDLKDLPRNQPIRLAIGIAGHREDRPSVGRVGEITARHVARRVEVRDETSGGDPQILDFKDLQVRWFLPNDSREGFETLEIVQLRWNVDRGVWRIDHDWLPTALSIEAWRGLGYRDLEAICDLLENRAETVSQRILSKRISAGSSGQELEFSRLMDALNVSLGESRAIRSPALPHPSQAYNSLCRILGSLALYHPERRMPRDILNYDHDNPEPAFRWLKQRIDASLAQDYEDPYQIRPFIGEGGDLYVRLDRRWLDADFNLVFAYRMTKLPAKDAKWEWALLKPRLSSPDLIRTVNEQHIVASERSLVALEPRPPFLPRDLVCYRFDKQNDLFGPVRDSAAIGMRLRGLDGHSAVKDGESMVRWQVENRPVESEFFVVAYPK